MKTVYLVGAALLSSCVTVQNSKTMNLPPSTTTVTVTSTARARCADAFFVMWCRLNMSLESSNGQVVSDFPKR